MALEPSVIRLHIAMMFRKATSSFLFPYSHQDELTTTFVKKVKPRQSHTSTKVSVPIEGSTNLRDLQTPLPHVKLILLDT